MDGMKITIRNIDGKVSRKVTTSYGDTESDSITWPDAVGAFLDLLRGLGYVFSTENEELVGVMEELNRKNIR